MGKQRCVQSEVVPDKYVLCRTDSRATDTSAAVMTGIDRYGFEMSATTSAGPPPIRIAFPSAIATPKEARTALVMLAQQGRKKSAP